ncbi:hypothetical protein GCM10023191_064730 [Actinoallomurus oryzae]|uniref:Uncharacterized protein n=1 Tax=Actinoallomurus oryzae TaxID=502180 RepID=A0ABP8QSZ3_9ACTN
MPAEQVQRLPRVDLQELGAQAVGPALGHHDVLDLVPRNAPVTGEPMHDGYSLGVGGQPGRGQHVAQAVHAEGQRPGGAEQEPLTLVSREDGEEHEQQRPGELGEHQHRSDPPSLRSDHLSSMAVPTDRINLGAHEP